MFGLFKKKRIDKRNEEDLGKQSIIEDRATIKNNVDSIEVLIAMVSDKEEIVSKLRKMQETIKYLNPSQEEEIHKMDQKIGNLLGDVKILLSKSELNSEKLEQSITDINVAIADRNLKLAK